MQFGLIVQMTGVLGYAQPLVRLARDAEAAGWDGFFIWDVFGGDAQVPMPVVDPWIALAAIATATERIRIGPMVTPLPRRRPWRLAREAASLDHLSGGRLILGVGIGDSPSEFSRFGEEADARVRGRMLDEGLAVLTGLWSGEPFSFRGEHYQVERALLLPRPVQQPRIPIWVGGTWPRKPSFRRAARWDGVFPGSLHGNLTLEELHDMQAFIQQHRTTDAPFDVMVGGDVPIDDPAKAREILTAYAAAGVTWWIEGIGEWRGDVDAMAAFIQGGPPGDSVGLLTVFLRWSSVATTVPNHAFAHRPFDGPHTQLRGGCGAYGSSVRPWGLTSWGRGPAAGARGRGRSCCHLRSALWGPWLHSAELRRSLTTFLFAMRIRECDLREPRGLQVYCLSRDSAFLGRR